MPRFRRRPTLVEAEQLTREAIEAHLFDRVPLPRGVSLVRANYHAGRRQLFDATCTVTTVHGEAAVIVPGDWIMPEPDGEHFYPCKPDIFAATYEPLEN